MASVTGSYTLKPRSYAGYISSGSFFDYFGGTAESDGIDDSGPRGGWKNAFGSHSNTCLGDSSDDTYLTMTPPQGGLISWHQVHTGYNALYNLSVTSGTVPNHAYVVTKVSVVVRMASTAGGTTNSDLCAHVSISEFGGQSFPYKFSVEHTNGSTKYNYSFSSNTQSTVSASNILSKVAICLNGSRNRISTNSWFRCYEITVTVNWRVNLTSYTAYVDNSITSFAMNTTDTDYFYIDVSSDVLSEAYGTENISYFPSFRKVTLYGVPNESVNIVSVLLNGYYFDGVYGDVSKGTVSRIFDTNPFNLGFPQTSDPGIYIISATLGKLYIGTSLKDKIYVGSDEIKYVYQGTTKIYQSNIRLIKQGLDEVSL